ATAIARFENLTAAAECVGALRTSPLQPVSCEWIGPENEIWLRFGEDSRAVDWQLKNLPAAADWKIVEGPDESAVWERLRNRYAALGPCVVRVVGMPAGVREMIALYRPQAWIAHVLNGIVLMQMESAEQVSAIRVNYRAVIERAPMDVRQRVPTFGLNA